MMQTYLAGAHFYRSSMCAEKHAALNCDPESKTHN